MEARAHTCWSFLLHFDKVSPALVVELSRTSVVEQRYVQLFLQVALHLAQLQGADTVSAVHGEVLLVIGAVGLAGRIKRKGGGGWLRFGFIQRVKNMLTRPRRKA